MSDCERWGTRDLTYSNWHREASIHRFIGWPAARALTMIDLDDIEYCCRCREVVGLIEVARDVGQAFKASIVTGQLAKRLGVPGLLAFYSPDPVRLIGNLPDIAAFRVRVIAPPRPGEYRLAPAEFAAWLVRMHERCACRLIDDDGRFPLEGAA